MNPSKRRKPAKNHPWKVLFVEGAEAAKRRKEREERILPAHMSPLRKVIR